MRFAIAEDSPFVKYSSGTELRTDCSRDHVYGFETKATRPQSALSPAEDPQRRYGRTDSIAAESLVAAA